MLFMKDFSEDSDAKLFILWMPQGLKKINLDKYGHGGDISEFSGCYLSFLHNSTGTYGVKATQTFGEFLY